MSIEQLTALMVSGEFHHATYRNKGTLWEGLWIYRKFNGARGFEPAGAFLKDSKEADEAYQLVRGTGISVGAYGQG